MLHQQNPPVRNCRCRLTQVDLYNGSETVVADAVVQGTTVREGERILSLPLGVGTDSEGQRVILFC